MRTMTARLAAAAMFAALAGTASAQQWIDPYAQPVTDGFEGLYVGITTGGMFDPSTTYLSPPDTTALQVGVAAGVNFYLTDEFLAGLEVQGSAAMGATATVYDAYALGRIGYAPSDAMMFYGAGGPGFAGGSLGYALGGGAEFTVTEFVSVRGEALGVGGFGGMPSAVKVTGGAIFHLD